MGISIEKARVMNYFCNTNLLLKKSNSYDSNVLNLQSDLTTLGYSTNGIDGYFGDNTKAAVIAFQNDYSLEADGIAGSQTLGKINELIRGATSVATTAPTPAPSYDSVSISGNLKIGSKGSAVKDLQEKLIKMGYDCGGYGADGDFGTGTYNSVIRFQKNYGLEQDGVVGTKTSQAIANALKTGSNGVPNYIMNKTNTSSVGTTTASTNISGNLQIGSKGSAVKDLQEKLIKMGYDCGGYGADGDFGTGTYNSVVKFQKDHQLVQDGIVGSQTNQAIANALKTSNNGVPNYITGKINASSTGSSTPSAGTNYSTILQRGSKGSEVVELQKNLIKMGYDCGKCGADGEFGTDTYNAVKKFQSDYGLIEDGIAGPQTNQAIANVLKTGNNGVPIYLMHKLNTSSTGVTMQIGSKGNSVVELQKKLITMGYDCGRFGADGAFGQDTYNAVKRFQSDYGLVQSGSIDSQTSQAISNALKIGNNGVPIYIMHKSNASSTASSTTSTWTTMLVGSKGSTVVELQKNLIRMGYDCGKCGADGEFGTDTYNAVKKFQSDYGLTQDGIVGPQTNQAIDNAIKTGSNGVPNYIMHKINSISSGKSIEWNNGVPKNIMNQINVGVVPKTDAVSIACAFFQGVGEGIVDGVKGLIDSIAHPIDTANGLLFLMKAGKIGTEENTVLNTMILKTLGEVWNDFSEGNADKKAEMIGKVVGEVIFMVAGTKGVGEATKALKASAETGKLSEIIIKYSKGTKNMEGVLDALDDVPPSPKGLIGHDFEEYLTNTVGGQGSFSVGGRDFDGGLGNRWWEAKSGDYWDMLMDNPDKLAKFKSDMGDRLKIATDNGATYELFSNTPISESVKSWLTKKGIHFTEILD